MLLSQERKVVNTVQEKFEDSKESATCTIHIYIQKSGQKTSYCKQKNVTKKKKKDADKLRLKFLEDKAQAIADEGNLELAAIYKQLI